MTCRVLPPLLPCSSNTSLLESPSTCLLRIYPGRESLPLLKLLLASVVEKQGHGSPSSLVPRDRQWSWARTPEIQMRKCQGTLGETQVTSPTLAKIRVKGHEDTGFLWTVSPRIGEERASFLCSLAPASQACKHWQMADCGYQSP